MELTASTINEAEFSMARRGYDPDQVDEFLEKLAVAVDKQNEALSEARARATSAEGRAAEAERRLAERPERVVGAPVAPVAEAPAAWTGAPPEEVAAAAEAELETLKRTLIQAQRTADATIREAEEEARRMVADAEEGARAAQESTKAEVLQEIAALDANRRALHGDISAMERHVGEQRQRLSGSIADLQRLLDDRLKPTPVPEPTVVAAAPAPPPAEAPVAASPAPDAAATPTPTPLAKSAPAPVRGENREGGPFSSRIAEPPRIRAAEDVAADEAWARFDVEADGDVDPGPPTQPVLRLDDLEDSGPIDDGGDDAYLSELRKAMLEDTGAPDVADAYDGEAPRSRFGRRR